MRDFTRGVMFVSGLTLFGKSMYELGKMKEQKEELERYKKFQFELNKILEKINNENVES